MTKTTSFRFSNEFKAFLAAEAEKTGMSEKELIEARVRGGPVTITKGDVQAKVDDLTDEIARLKRELAKRPVEKAETVGEAHTRIFDDTWKTTVKVATNPGTYLVNGAMVGHIEDRSERKPYVRPGDK